MCLMIINSIYIFSLAGARESIFSPEPTPSKSLKQPNSSHWSPAQPTIQPAQSADNILPSELEPDVMNDSPLNPGGMGGDSSVLAPPPQFGNPASLSRSGKLSSLAPIGK